MPDRSKDEGERSAREGRVSLTAPTERVAKAAARVLIAANKKLGVESDEKTKRLAES